MELILTIETLLVLSTDHQMETQNYFDIVAVSKLNLYLDYAGSVSLWSVCLDWRSLEHRNIFDKIKLSTHGFELTKKRNWIDYPAYNNGFDADYADDKVDTGIIHLTNRPKHSLHRLWNVDLLANPSIGQPYIVCNAWQNLIYVTMLTYNGGHLFNISRSWIVYLRTVVCKQILYLY